MRPPLSLRTLVYVFLKEGHPPSKEEAFSYISGYNPLNREINADKLLWPSLRALLRVRRWPQECLLWQTKLSGHESHDVFRSFPCPWIWTSCSLYVLLGCWLFFKHYCPTVLWNVPQTECSECFSIISIRLHESARISRKWRVCFPVCLPTRPLAVDGDSGLLVKVSAGFL